MRKHRINLPESMKLDGKYGSDSAESHGGKQNVDFKIAGGQKAGGGHRQEPGSQDEKRTAGAGAANEKAGTGTDSNDEQEAEPRLRRLQWYFSTTNADDKRRLQRINQSSAPNRTRGHSREEGESQWKKEWFPGKRFQDVLGDREAMGAWSESPNCQTDYTLLAIVMRKEK